jgi:MFS family permease
LLDVLRIPNVRLILIFTAITYLAFSLLQSSFPLFARANIFPDLPLEVAQGNIGLLLTWIGVLNVIMQTVFVGPLVRRFGEQRLIVAGTVARILAFVGVGLSRSPIAAAIAIVPLSIGNSVSQPSLQSIISRFSPPEMRGRILGTFQSTNSLTLIIGPILAGLILEASFPFLSDQTTNALPMFAAAGLVTIAAVLSLRVQRMELPTQEKTEAQVAAAPAH